jgi:hypothetical protein
MVIQHSLIHDIIARARLAEPLTEKEYSYKALSHEEVLALTYLPGVEVKDRVTGKEGEVIAGTRATVTTG